MKVWENSKKLWKHSPTAPVPTAFLVLPNFHSCFHNSMKHGRCFPFLKYYMVSSRRAIKMNQILRCDWLPDRSRWHYLARSGLRATSAEKIILLIFHIVNPLLIKLVQSRSLDIGLDLCQWRVSLMDFDTVSIRKPWQISGHVGPHAWSITHITA